MSETKRPGRPSLGKTRLHIALSPQNLDLLSIKAQEAGLTLSEQIEILISSTWRTPPPNEPLPDLTHEARRARTQAPTRAAAILEDITAPLARMRALALAKEPERQAYEDAKRRHDAAKEASRQAELAARRRDQERWAEETRAEQEILRGVPRPARVAGPLAPDPAYEAGLAWGRGKEAAYQEAKKKGEKK